MKIKNPNRRQMDFHTSLEHEVHYSAKDRDDGLYTMCMDAIFHTLEFCESNAAIFVRTRFDEEAVGRMLPSLASLAGRFKKEFGCSTLKWFNGSRIEIRHIGDDEYSLWKLAGAEWQWLYLFDSSLFTGEQVAYLKTRARNYPKTHYHSVRHIVLRNTQGNISVEEQHVDVLHHSHPLPDGDEPE